MNTVLLVAAAVVAALSIPLILKAVPPNYFYGFRTPSTLSDEPLWYRANVFAGLALLFASIVSAAILLAHRIGVLPVMAHEVVAFVFPLLVALAACFVYLRSIRGKVPGGRK